MQTVVAYMMVSLVLPLLEFLGKFLLHILLVLQLMLLAWVLHLCALIYILISLSCYHNVFRNIWVPHLRCAWVLTTCVCP
jgi:hypothetical protein